MTVLNAAVTDIFLEANVYLESELGLGQSVDQALMGLIKKLMGNSLKAVFNGDGYSKEWVTEAAKRGLPNLRTTPEALKTMTVKEDYAFLVRNGIFKEEEIETRYNILLERYIKIREIELETMIDMIHQFVIPSGLEYKAVLANLIKSEKEFGASSSFEIDAYKRVSTKIDEVHALSVNLQKELSGDHSDHQKYAEKIANELMTTANSMAGICNGLEELIPNQFYSLPKYYDMLFFFYFFLFN
jgi:glutamine synthetase